MPKPSLRCARSSALVALPLLIGLAAPALAQSGTVGSSQPNGDPPKT